jgi:hypothetical protein
MVTNNVFYLLLLSATVHILATLASHVAHFQFSGNVCDSGGNKQLIPMFAVRSNRDLCSYTGSYSYSQNVS